jgi:hypothetical protein
MHGTKNCNYVNIGYTPIEVRRCHWRNACLKRAGARRVGCGKGGTALRRTNAINFLELVTLSATARTGQMPRLGSCQGGFYATRHGPLLKRVTQHGRSLRRIPDAQRVRNELKTYRIKTATGSPEQDGAATQSPPSGLIGSDVTPA